MREESIRSFKPTPLRGAAGFGARPPDEDHRDMKGLLALAFFAVAVAAIASLVSGASYLDFVLPGGLPAGNAVAALGLVALAGIPACLSARGSLLRRTSLVTLVGAAAWLPVSIALAGNPALNFTGWRGSVWLGFSVIIHVAALCVLAWALLARLLAMRRRSRAG
jgi:hypothetical protein